MGFDPSGPAKWLLNTIIFSKPGLEGPQENAKMQTFQLFNGRSARKAMLARCQLVSPKMEGATHTCEHVCPSVRVWLSG